MSLNPQDKEIKRLPIPDAGVVPARLARVIELGIHDTFYGEKDQVILVYSLPTRIIEEEGDYLGKQHHVRTAPLRKSSSDKSTLMEHIRVLNPTATSLDQILDKVAFITVTHNEVESGGSKRTFANITNISGVPEGIEVGELDTTKFYFDFDSPDEDVWSELLWDSMREQIKSALNYKGSAVEEMVLRLEAMKSE